MNSSKKNIVQIQQDYVSRFSSEIFNRPGLGKRTRILLNLAMLTMAGEREVLRKFIYDALDLGCSRTAIRETLLQTISFAGHNKVSLATNIAQEVFMEIDKLRHKSRQKAR